MLIKFSANKFQNDAMTLDCGFSSKNYGVIKTRFRANIDTGSDITMIPENVLEKEKPVLRGNRITACYANGEFRKTRTFLGYVYIFDGEEVFAYFSNSGAEGFFSTPNEVGLIGLDIIMSLKLVISYPNIEIYKNETEA